MTKVYVAGPFTADSKEAIEANVNEAFFHAKVLKSKGYTPFIPHLLFFYEQWERKNFANHLSYEEAMGWDEAFLVDCDILYVIAESRGVLREIEKAKELGIPIVYAHETIEEVKIA